MRTTTLMASVGVALLLAGCGNGGGGGGNVSGAERNRLVQACTSETNNDRPMCECVADLAREDLTPGSFRMLLASVEGDDQTATRLRGELSFEELTASGMFMVSAFGRCAESRSGR